MKIERDLTVKDLMTKFATEFPLLQLRFYKKPHDHFEGSKSRDEVSHSLSLSELNPDLNGGEIILTKEMSVDELETILEDKFGLHAQVFRKSGDIWLQTSKTDSWSLERHTQSAQQSSDYKEHVS